MYYLVVLYDNIIGNYEYVISESKSACKNLENNKKFVDCKSKDPTKKELFIL